ncbi:hypothetical protein PFWH6_5035 [Pseudomonas fluorescens WH6]|nr:hypothetical protein PFWH6_5035 [Pseudomonas fluorescens WH6]
MLLLKPPEMLKLPTPRIVSAEAFPNGLLYCLGLPNVALPRGMGTGEYGF